MAKKNRSDGDSDFLESVQSEVEDAESSPRTFDVVTFPADLTLIGIFKELEDDEILIPEFQRKFVWKQKQASRLIESFLLGLPVPPVFLFTRKDGKKLVIDGQQRLKSIGFFFRGFFGDPDGTQREEFRLVGLNENSPYHNKTYSEIKATDPVAFRALNGAVLRSFVVKQLKPAGDASIYHIFERLNTGGTSLVGQEIRNCIYHGSFNEMLRRLNNPPGKESKLTVEEKDTVAKWREILGKPKVDSRLRDVELILRFFALHFNMSYYEKPMKDFLSTYMDKMKDADQKTIEKCEKLFRDTVKSVHAALGPKPFHIHHGMNVAVFDSVFLAFAQNRGPIPSDIQRKFHNLIPRKDYLPYITAATTDDAVVPERLKTAKKILFGV